MPNGRKVWRTRSIVATADHNTPTTGWERGYDGITDPTSREQVTTLDSNIHEFGAAAFFPFLHKRQGIVHVIGPENGATLPGMTVVCGDSHTSTHGAFGALAFGIGTSEVEHVLATQTLPQAPAKTLAITVDGALPPARTAKDIILALLGRLGPARGIPKAFDAGDTREVGDDHRDVQGDGPGANGTQRLPEHLVPRVPHQLQQRRGVQLRKRFARVQPVLPQPFGHRAPRGVAVDPAKLPLHEGPQPLPQQVQRLAHPLMVRNGHPSSPSRLLQNRSAWPPGAAAPAPPEAAS